MLRNPALQTTSTIIGMCIFLILVGLIGIESNIIISNRAETHYFGPYSCDAGNIVIRYKKTQTEQDKKIDILLDGVKVNTYSYSLEGVSKISPLPWKEKCEPIVVEKNEMVDQLAICLRQIISKGSLSKDTNKKNQTISLCGVAFFDKANFTKQSKN